MILTFAGTRPELIKLSRLVPELDKRFDQKFIFTGQHYSKSMVDVFLEEMEIRKPDDFLSAKSSEQSDLLPPIRKLIKKEKPETVILYGDTNSTLAAAIAARAENVPNVVHIEAGLRSFDNRMEEEKSRILIDHMSDLLFTPTGLTASFIEREGIAGKKYIVGNTVVDACVAYSEKSDASDILNGLNLEKDGFIVSTIHRAENVDSPDKLARLMSAFNHMQFPVVLPVHPRTRARLAEFGYQIPSNVKAIDPVGYFDMLKLMKNSALIITDSGGVQEEAITLKVPCITARETTERWETVELGANFLAGSDPLLVSYIAKMIMDTGIKSKLSKVNNPYGDGTTSSKIASLLEQCL